MDIPSIQTYHQNFITDMQFKNILQYSGVDKNSKSEKALFTSR